MVGGNWKDSYLELVNIFVNSPHESWYKITGAQEGIRTPTPSREADSKFTTVGSQGFVTVPSCTGS